MVTCRIMHVEHATWQAPHMHQVWTLNLGLVRHIGIRIQAETQVHWQLPSYDAQIRHGYGRNMPWIWQGHGLHEKVNYQIQYDLICCLLFKYPGIIAPVCNTDMVKGSLIQPSNELVYLDLNKINVFARISKI